MSKATVVLLVLIVALLCFLAALLIATSTFVHGGNYDGWIAGGFVLAVAAKIIERLP